MSLSLQLFRTYTDGFLSACGDSLTEKEIEMLPTGAKMMTLECGLRFLTDHLNGDTYYKIQYPEHNLVRTRAQMRLLEEQEKTL